MASNPHLDLIIVVSGVPEPVRINMHEPLENAVRQALRESHAGSSSPADWELRTEQGVLLDQNVQAGSVGLHEGQTLFLNPRAGAGG
jgi:hypothetical protein